MTRIILRMLITICTIGNISLRVNIVVNLDGQCVFKGVYTNLKVYHFLIKKCTTPNRLQRYA